MKKSHAMEKEIEALLNWMKKDYIRWHESGRSNTRLDGSEDVRDAMCANYADGLRVIEGSKYLKVVGTGGMGSSESVMLFVVKSDNDKKFRKGDLLKPVGWGVPARNFPRGNVLEGTLERIAWTGAN
jgi:hypothetical protein